MSQIYLIRHCAATGQEPSAELTSAGIEQSFELANFLEQKSLKRIISSDYKRAVSSAKPLAERLGVSIETDERLRECDIGEVEDGDWRAALGRCLDEPNLRLPKGETTSEAAVRGRAVIDELCDEGAVGIFTHGYLITIICKTIDPSIGYEFWAELLNPDVVEIRVREGVGEVRKVEF